MCASFRSPFKKYTETRFHQYGSGVIGVIFRMLVAPGFKSTSPLEIHVYSGLLGSQTIASSYSKVGAAVKVVIQLGMTTQYVFATVWSH